MLRMMARTPLRARGARARRRASRATLLPALLPRFMRASLRGAERAVMNVIFRHDSDFRRISRRSFFATMPIRRRFYVTPLRPPTIAGCRRFLLPRRCHATLIRHYGDGAVYSARCLLRHAAALTISRFEARCCAMMFRYAADAIYSLIAVIWRTPPAPRHAELPCCFIRGRFG